MDISIIGYCLPIVVICYVVGLFIHGFKKFPNEQIPVTMAVVGGILGFVGMGVIPDFPATDYITAIAVGAFSGLTATGVNQIYKQTKKTVNE